MSDTDNNSGATGVADGSAPRTVESIHAEMARKTEKLASENAALSQKLDQALAIMANQQRAGQQPTASTSLADISDEKLEELSYKDPKLYAKAVEAKAEKKASAMIDQRLYAQDQSNRVMGQLIGDYPELNDQSSDLSRKAVELYNQLPAHIKADPIAYKTAVRDAAADLGMLPKSKRTKTDDGSYTASGTQSTGQRSTSQQQKQKVSDATLEFAERIGVNIKDPKVVERLTKRAERKNWGRFE